MILRFSYLAILLLASLCTEAHAQQRFIVRVSGGAATLERLCGLLRCDGLRSLGDPHGRVFVVTISGEATLLGSTTDLLRSSGLIIEPDLPVSLLAPAPRSGQAPSGLMDTRPADFAGTAVWRGYAQQPAAAIIRSQEARNRFGVSGFGPVAVIDTGVDPNHPALRSVLLPGYDFTRNRQVGSELADVDQSTTAVVDGGRPTRVNNMMVAGLDQSTTAVVDNPEHQAFGHGTMVAGLVHLVAPRAQILPLKAFGSNGSGYTSDIIRAVYFAVDNNARVINMSFSMRSRSLELATAIEHAVSRKVICISSAGNDGQRTNVYPASLDTVMGVGSTNIADDRSSFSNYGNSLVWIAAPGEQIISTYPFSAYAAASGASFSTAFVSGAGALLVDSRPSINHSGAADAISNGKPVGGELGRGRLDVHRALQALR